jgi:hypothetical protein
MNTFLITIPHTGSFFAIDQLKREGHRVTMSHFYEPSCERKKADAELVVTTFRHPLRVAASWLNRRDITPEILNKWRECWSAWFDLIKDPSVRIIELTGCGETNSVGDLLGYHKLVDQIAGDL